MDFILIIRNWPLNRKLCKRKKVNNKIETTAKNYLNLNCTSQEWGLLGVTRVTNSQGVTQSYFLKAVYLNQNMIAPLNSLLRNLKNKYLNNFLQNIFLMRNNIFFWRWNNRSSNIKKYFILCDSLTASYMWYFRILPT